MAPTARPAAAAATLTLRDRYARELAARGYQPDGAQLYAIEQLDAVRAQLLARPAPGLLARWLRRRRLTSTPRPWGGLYLWGPVGGGKTWLMDLFYDSLPVRERRRSHFHHFMRDVHQALGALRSRPEPLQRIARQWAARARVLCLDELYVSDIADAMILGTLFEALLGYGTTLVITSNVPPSQLYRDGLQRSRFLPAIALLEHELQLVPVDGGTDYRLRQLQRRPIYLPSDVADTPQQLQRLFDELAGPSADDAAELQLQGRKLRALQRRGAVVWFSFAALCEGPRSQNDYVQLAEEFHCVLLSDVPVFRSPQQDNAARRFIALVDELYDQGVKLILSAAAPPAELYRAERLQADFARTASRLVEMQSESYLARAHRRDGGSVAEAGSGQ